MSPAHAFLCSLVAFGTQWPIIDLPYPDVDRAGGAVSAASVETQVEEAAVRYARDREPRAAAARRPELSHLRIEGTRASVLLTTGERKELLQLQLLDREWRVVQSSR